MPRFPVCLAETLRWEGGYSDEKHDPGGKTMKGIIQREYDAYRKKKGLQPQWVKLISDAEVTEIYYDSYWTPVRADETFDGLDLELFDEAVNSGPSTAIKHLQQVLGGLAVDGHMGTQTVAAVNAVSDREKLVRDYIARREAYLKSLGTFRYFGKGWMDRCQGIEHSAVQQCHGAPLDHVKAALDGVAQPHSDPDTQSAGQGRAPAPVPVPPVGTELTLQTAAGGGFALSAAQILGEAGSSGRLTVMSIVVALVKSPLFWGALVLAWASIHNRLWRRVHIEWASS